MGANQSNKAPVEAPHQFDATNNNIGISQNNNKLSFRKQHIKLFNRKGKSQLLAIHNNLDDSSPKSSHKNGTKSSKISSNESQQLNRQLAKSSIDQTWSGGFDATNEPKPGYYVSSDGRKLMQSNNKPSIQQAYSNNNDQQYHHEIDRNYSNGSSHHHINSDRLVGAMNTLGRRDQPRQRPLTTDELHSTPQKSSQLRDSSSKLLNNNINVKDHHQQVSQPHHQQHQLNSNGNSMSSNAIGNNNRNNFSQTSRSSQQQPVGSSSPSDDSFIATTTTPSATIQQQQQHQQQPLVLNNGVPYHLSRAVNSKTSNVLNNNSQQKNNNYNYNHNSRNDDENNVSAVAMTNASNGSPLANEHQNHYYQRASSESWSKHHHQQMVLAALQQQQQHRNNIGQTNRQSYQQEVQPNFINRSTSGHQSLNTSLASYGPAHDHRPAQSFDDTENTYYDEITNHNQDFDDDLEQYYSRNLHLLDQQQRKNQAQTTEFPENQFYSTLNNNNNNNNSVYQAQTTEFANGYMSAPLQRRYKWPKQQYQYLNQAAEVQSPVTYRNQHLNSQAQFVAATPTNNTKPYDNYNRSYSFESASRRKSSTGRIKNPLAALFYPTNSQNLSSGSSTSTQFKKYSNTIHLSSSKSHQTLNLSNNQRVSCPSGGSLKRIKSSPLTAQQASYEAMRTIDMYLIRQIARSCMDFEMEQKIELEIRLRELAAHSLLEARNEIDVLEVEKSLLTSDQRMNCYAGQLELQRKQLSNPSLSTADSGRASKSSSSGAHPKPAASDVIGQATCGGGSPSTNSPSFSSLSNSQSSPSKLSPVSGQSANSPTGTPADSATSTQNKASPSKDLFRRQSGYSSSHSNSNTLNRRHRKGQQQQQLANEKRRREQLMQSITHLSNINCNMVVNNKASLSLSELRIPLMWRDVDHFKGRGDYKRYAVFCLLKVNSQIFDTQLISDVDRQMTDLNFDDVIVFNDLGHEFELTLEVYSCVYLEQFSLSSTPRKLKEKLSSSVSRAMGRRLATQTASANYTKELQAYDKSYRFAMIASAKLRLDDASDQVKTYDLVLVSPTAHHRHSAASTTNTKSNNNSHLLMTTSDYNNASGASASAAAAANITTAGLVTASNQKDAHKNTLPLFGHFCCKFNVRPDVFDKNVKIGYLRVADINVQPMTTTTTTTTMTTTTMTSQPASGVQSPNGTTRSSASSSSSTTGGASASSVGSRDSVSDCSMLRSALAASSKLASLSMSSASIHWALLRNFALHLWPVDEQKLELALARGQNPQVDISRKPPFSMAIDKYTKLLRVSNSSLTIETDRGCFVLAVYNLPNQHDEIGHWLRPIEQYIYDSHLWGSALNHYPPQTSGVRQQQLTNSTTATSESNRLQAGDQNHHHQQQQQHHQQQRHRTPKSATRLTNAHETSPPSLGYVSNNRTGKQHEHRHSHHGTVMQADL